LVWRLYAVKEGFEHPRIRGLQTAATRYVTIEQAVADARGNLAGEFQRRVAELRQAATSSPLDFAALEAAAAWLQATGQAPAELAQLQSQFHEPLIVGLVHRGLVEDKLSTFERTSREQRSTRQQIQGAAVVGTATVDSRTTASLVEDAADARLRIVTRGSVSAPRNVSQSGRVRVVSSSSSQFTVTADIFWDGKQFVATNPNATADLRSRIRGIDAPRLVRRAAERRVYAARGSAQAEAESLVERQAEESMAERLTVAVEKLNQKSVNFLAFITRTGNTAERWQTRVGESAIEIGFMPPSDSGLGARPQAIPPLVGEETLGLSFHDGAFEAIFRAQLAGKKWADVDLSMMQRELTGGNSTEHMVGLDGHRWSVHWSWRRPVAIHFTPEFTRVTYRYAGAEIDGDAYDAPFEVRARMTVSSPPLGFEMHLLEPPTVVGIDPHHPLPPHFQGFLERKFRGLFGEKFSLDGLQFPAGGALDGMSAFRVCRATLDANWVHLRYTNRKPHAEFVVHKTPPTPSKPSAASAR
jgi:hypothetical protein